MSDSALHHPGLVWHAHADSQQWCAAITDALAHTLAGAGANSPMRLLLSGGGTPAPVYAALARRPLPWAHIELGLVDERWLPAADPNRNDVLVRQHLLAHQPATRLQPLAQEGRSWQDSAAAANAWWQAGPQPQLAVLGMGADGHTASLFPGSLDLAAASRQALPYTTLDASGCPGAQAWPQRLSLTPAGLAGIARRLLLLRGADKRQVLADALASADPARYPVLHALQPGAPLQVHWCA